MLRRLGRWFIRGLIELVIGLTFASLLFWQALVIGAIDDLVDCLLLFGRGVLIFLALLALHELGHLLAALAMGLPFRRFTIGLLTIAREHERIRVLLNTAWFRPAAYFQSSFPEGGVPAWRWAVVVLGGPMANLLFVPIFLLAASWMNPGPPAEMPSALRVGWRTFAWLNPGDMATALLNIAAILSLALGLGTLVPGTSAGVRTDGGQLLDLWRRKGSSDADARG